MGMYTKLHADLILKSGATTDELLMWLDDNSRELPHNLSSFEFFNCPRAHYFSVEDGPFKTVEGVRVSIRADLKNYECEIQKFFEVVKPLYLSGSFRSLYEEHILWFNHVKNDFIGPEGACPLCGECHASSYRCC